MAAGSSSDDFVYTVYGVALTSDTPLALPPMQAECTISVRLRTGDALAFAGIREEIASCQDDEWVRHFALRDGRIYMAWGDWLEVIVTADGSDVTYNRRSREAPDGFEAYIANFAVSAALLQHGEEPLHATVIGHDERGIGFLGPSGAGKSTLAAYMIQRGASLVTDDMLRIRFREGAAWAEPGPQRLKLFAEPARRYLSGAVDVGQWNPRAEKMLFEPSDPRAVKPPVRLSALVWLGVPIQGDTADAVSLTKFEGLELFRTIAASTMNSRIMTPERLTRQLRFAEHVGQVIPVYGLHYPRRHEIFGEVGRVLQQVLA